MNINALAEAAKKYIGYGYVTSSLPSSKNHAYRKGGRFCSKCYLKDLKKAKIEKEAKREAANPKEPTRLEYVGYEERNGPVVRRLCSRCYY